jgi:hypothetical protein
MGTPCACIYTTVVCRYHEHTKILSRFNNQVLPYLQCFIGNMLGIWCGVGAKWEIFKASLDGFSKHKCKNKYSISIEDTYSTSSSFRVLTMFLAGAARHTCRTCHFDAILAFLQTKPRSKYLSNYQAYMEGYFHNMIFIAETQPCL